MSGRRPATERPTRRAGRVDGDGLRRLLPLLLAAWFVAISAMRLRLVWDGGPAFDGILYRAATLTWLQGGNPWSVAHGGVYFAAPPPSLLPMIPFALLPEAVAVPALLLLCLAASAWAIRRLGAPWWWLAFPPLVDGIWNANLHVVVLPLILAGLAPLAALVKVYAAVVPAIRWEWRALVGTAIALLVTAPFLPWPGFVEQLPQILVQLRVQSDGGQSVFGLPMPSLVVAAAVAVAGLIAIGRDRAAWLAVPVLWPSTQWYYASIAIPGLVGSGAGLLGAAVLAAPIPQAPLIAVTVMAGAIVVGRARYRSESETIEPSRVEREPVASR